MEVMTYAYTWDWTRVLISILTLTGISIVGRFTYNIYFHPLSHIPGPRLWAATPIFYAQSVRSGRYAQNLKGLHIRYGPVVRVAPDELSFIHSAAWDVIYAYNKGTSFPKSSRWFQARPNGATGIIASSNEDHGRFRRTFAPAFTEKALSEREGLISRYTNELMLKLTMAADAGEPVNMTDWLEFVSFDIAGDFAFSESFECLASPDNRPQIRFVQAAMKIFALRPMRRTLGIETLHNLLTSLMTRVRSGRTVYQKSLSHWTRARLEGGEKAGARDLMGWVARSTGGSKTLLPTEAENAVGDFMIAGTETVASTTMAAIYHLIKHPQIMDELRAEIRGICPKAVDNIDVKKLEDLKLLNAVIKEVMRLCPSLPTVLPRVVPSPGTEVCGYWIPAGNFVSFGQYAAYHNPVNFSDPDRFLPYRWIDPVSFEKHDVSVFHPFSVGPRNCIGKSWGLMAVRTLLATIVLRFNLVTVGPEWEWEEQNAWFIWEKRDLIVQLKSLMV